MRDTDGVMWREVVLSIRLEVMADTTDEAAYHAFLCLPDHLDDIDDWIISVVPETDEVTND